MAFHYNDPKSAIIMDGRSIVLEKQNKTKQKKEAKNMNESMKAEIEKSAQFIDLSAEEAMDKFKEICSENGIEIDNPIAKGVWRMLLTPEEQTMQMAAQNQKEMILSINPLLVSLFLQMLQEI